MAQFAVVSLLYATKLIKCPSFEQVLDVTKNWTNNFRQFTTLELFSIKN